MASSLTRFLYLATFFAVVFRQASGEDMLFSGESLGSNEFIENGQYRFIMQSDCNLVLYADGTRVLWASNTDGRGLSCRANLLNDGRLVVVSGNSTELWSNGRAVGPNTYRLIMQGDGNVVIYGAPVWATNTVTSK